MATGSPRAGAARSRTAGTPANAIVTVLAWGFAFGAVPVCVQMWMFASSPQLYEAGSALMVSAFQIAVSAGAAIGGVLVDSLGIGSAFLTGGAVCIAGAVIPLTFHARTASKPSTSPAPRDAQ